MKSVKGGGFVAKIIKISNPGSPNLEVLAHPICFCPLGVWQYDQPVHLGVPFLWTKSCSQKIGIFRFMGSKMGFPAHGFEYCFNVPPNGGWSQWDSSLRMPFINLTYNVGPPSYKLVYKPQ